MRWEVLIPRLEAVLKCHFGEDASNEADNLYQNWVAADAVQKLDRSDRSPMQDKASLDLAVKQIEQAAGNISKTGWHGNKVLPPLAARIAHGEDGVEMYRLMGLGDASSIISDHLNSLANTLRDCSGSIDEQGGSVVEVLSGSEPPSPSAGGPRKTAARLMASSCAHVYFQQTGKQPSVIVDFMTSKASGPFLNFVSDIFQALDLHASAENHANEAAKEKIAKESE